MALVFCLLVLLCVLNVIRVEGVAMNRTLPPVLYFPGYGASQLFAQVDDAKYIPSACANVSIPIGTAFLVEDNTKCGMTLLTSLFDPQTALFTSPEGIRIFTGQVGDFTTISSNNYDFVKILESWGYVVGVNLFGVPYDYRLMSDASLTANGFISSVTNLIEHVVKLNQGRKVVVIGHSNGGPTMYTYLTSTSVRQTWKDTHIQAMVGLSGNYLGQMNCISTFLYNPEALRQDMAGSWEANYGSITWGGYEPALVYTIVTTYSHTPQEKNYTASVADLADLFTSVNRQDWVQRLYGVYGMLPVNPRTRNNNRNMMDRSAHPRVNVHCLYGMDLPTVYQYVYGQGAHTNSFEKVGVMGGDGDQDIVDNTFCATWATDVRGQGFVTEAVGFSNVTHMDMYCNDQVMQKVYSILDSYRS